MKCLVQTSLGRMGICLAVSVGSLCALRASVVYETTSVYHHIQVLDQAGRRTLSFNGSAESRMALANPLHGHFEYVEHFHLARLWATNATRALMIGLGGGSAQRTFRHYQPDVAIETVEIDPAVVEVARRFFGVAETPQLKIHTEDGRVYLRRSQANYDLILVDAYATTRYGSAIPQHLVTREFFELARARLTTNGVLAYNVIGRLQGWQSGLVAAVYRTLKDVFPQVYLFPSTESYNVVLIATMDRTRWSRVRVSQQARWQVQQGRVKLPTYVQRASAMVDQAAFDASRAPVLTDDYAPVEGLTRR